MPFNPIQNPADELALRQGCHFDQAAGDRVCRFLETFCRQSKGEWAAQPLTLIPWQRDALTRLYGWKRPDGTRRYRTFYIEVPKKNGKSTLLSGLALYHLIADGEPGAEVYCCAYDLNQSRIIYDESLNMVKASPSLARILKPLPSAKRITHESSASKFQALSADVPSKDGFNASFVIFDELHRQKTRSLWDILIYAGSARRQPLLGSITTAGYDRQSICYEQHDYTNKVNAGLVEDTSHFGVIYGAQPEDRIDDPAVWRKANPSLGHTLKEDDFATEVKRALESQTELNNFLRLRLNLWTNADERFLRRDKWDECGTAAVEEKALEGRQCWAGLDLSSTIDISALVLIFGDDTSGYDALCRFWIPEENAELRERRDRVPYLTWARQGLVTLTPGTSVDYSYIRAEIQALAKTYDLRKIHIDRWNATQIAGELREQDGIAVENFGQGFASMSAPTKELERIVLAGKLRHGSNPVLNWMADNAVSVSDAAGNLKIAKDKSSEKVDGIIALIMALAGATGENQGPSVYETRGVLIV